MARLQAEGEGFEPPGPFGRVRFRDGCLSSSANPPVTWSHQNLMSRNYSYGSPVKTTGETPVPRHAAGGIRTHTQTVLETAASAVGLPRRGLFAGERALINSGLGTARLSNWHAGAGARSRSMRVSALSRIRTCNTVLLGHGPLPGWGYQSVCRSQWTPVGIEPTFPGCRPGVLPLDDGPMSHAALREGIEPSASAFGGPRSDPVELPQRNSCQLPVVSCQWKTRLAFH